MTKTALNAVSSTYRARGQELAALNTAESERVASNAAETEDKVVSTAFFAQKVQDLESPTADEPPDMMFSFCSGSS